MDNKINTDATEVQKVSNRYHVYKQRWLLVAVISLQQLTNGAIWINFASIANHTAVYFGVTNDKVNWLSMVFFVTFGPLIFLTMWIVDRFGLKYDLYLGCATNFCGGLLRLFSTCNFVPDESRYAVAITGQAVASLTLPLIVPLQTKLSQDWFPENQRTLCTSLCTMSSTAGSALGTFIPTLIVHSSSDVPLMNFVFCGGAMVAGALGIFVRNSKPPTPPSSTAKQLTDTDIRQPYLTELIKVLKNIQFDIFMVTSGGLTIGIMSTLSSVSEQMFCAWGYSNTIVGISNGVMIGCSLLGVAIFTYLCEKTKRMKEIIKISFALCVPVYIGYVLILQVPCGKYIVVILSALIGTLGTGLFPICLEIAVEDTYPINESITSGLISLSAQVQAAIYVPLMSLLKRPLNSRQLEIQSCTVSGSTEAYDMTYSGVLIICLAAFFTICLIVFYNPKYRRMEAEGIEKNRINDEQNNEINNTQEIQHLS